MAIKVLAVNTSLCQDSHDLHADEVFGKGAGDAAAGLLLLPLGLNDERTRKCGIIYGRGHFNCCVNFRGINARCFSQWNAEFSLGIPSLLLCKHRETRKWTGLEQAWGERGVVITAHGHFKHKIPGCAISVALTLTDKRWKDISFLLNNHKVTY